jgi:hypothetical protein
VMGGIGGAGVGGLLGGFWGLVDVSCSLDRLGGGVIIDWGVDGWEKRIE